MKQPNNRLKLTALGRLTLEVQPCRPRAAA
jgi:hypothetical protein